MRENNACHVTYKEEGPPGKVLPSLFKKARKMMKKKEFAVNGVKIKIVQVVAGYRKDLLVALKRIGDDDKDFTGENGEQYLWKEARGFKSNREYLIDKVKDIESDTECVKTFFETWKKNDSFYKDAEYQFIENRNGYVEAIEFAYKEVL